MTRTQLMIYAQQEYDKALSKHTYKEYARLNKSQAYYVDTGIAIILKSYDTIVAILNKRNGSLYVLNYYSATTAQHIYKFANMLFWDRIVYLYYRRDRIAERYVDEDKRIKDFKISKALWDNLIQNDFSMSITNRWD